MEGKWLFRTLRYGSGLLIALLIFWGFYGFVKNDNWLAVSALATLILAVAAFFTLMITTKGRKQERREDRRMEILQWAIEVAIFALQRRTEARNPLISDFAYLSDREKELFTSLEPLRVRSVYMEEIASKMEPNLKKTIESLISELRAQIGLLHKSQRGEEKKSKELVNNIRCNFNRIHQRAVEVTKEVAQVNTRDL